MQEVDKVRRGGRTKILIGNKSDLQLERAVTYEEAQALACTLGAAFFETSAKDAHNVEEMLSEAAIQQHEFWNPTPVILTLVTIVEDHGSLVLSFTALSGATY